MNKLRKIAVIIVILFFAFAPLLAVIPAFGQDTGPNYYPPAKFTYMYTEGISMQVDAPEGYVFSNVVWADFGKPYFDNNFNLNIDPTCTTSFSTMYKLFNLINGKTSVVISADPAIYGNPCPEYSQVLAYTIQATLISPTPKSNPTPSQIPTKIMPTPVATVGTPTPELVQTPSPSPTLVEPTTTPTPSQEPKFHKLSSSNSIGWKEISPEARKKGQKVIVATVIVSQIATTASMIRKRK